MLFYSPTITPRLQYVTRFAGEVLGASFTLTLNKEGFLASVSPKLNYSAERFSEDELWMLLHPLLFEEGINAVNVGCFRYNGMAAFFETEGDYPFDLFAASFYLVSRYEEYLPHAKDAYGRFDFKSSLAFLNGFLNVPLVNLWLADFKQCLLKKFTLLSLRKKAFAFIPTYDIDEAYSYKHKGVWRTFGGAAKSFLKGRLTEVQERLNVLQGKATDPFFSYDWMDELHEKYGLHPRYFFLVAARLSQYDRNILPRKKALKNLIIRHSGKYSVGVHPSWRSSDEPELLSQEIKTLEAIIQRPVVSSRQHFIRFNLPGTYRLLITAGIREEFSMGYGSVNGFRASAASPFYWFDLERNQQTELLLYPFCYMDANSFFEQRLGPEQALEEMKFYFETVKAVNGCFVSIWHNTFLGTGELLSGWREGYADFLAYAAERSGQ